MDFGDHELIVHRQGRCRHGAVVMDPAHANASDIAVLELTRFASCWMPASQMPATPAVAERVPRPARSEKFNVS
jgi:hypothetical protein